MFVLGARLALRFYWSVLPSIHAWPCSSGGADCRRLTSGDAVLLSRFAVDSRLALRFWRGDCPWRVWPSVSGGAVCARLTSGDAVLARRFALDACPALHLWRGGLASVHACCLPHGVKQDGLRCVAFLFRRSRSPFVRSHSVLRLSALVGSLRLWPFLYGDLDGVTGSTRNERRGYEGTGLAARLLCAFAQSHRPCNAFRREYVGAARPKPAPKSLRLSGLSSRCGGVILVRVRPPSPGHTERPVRL